MRSVFRGSLLLLCLGACGGETVSLELGFPSGDAFVRAANTQLFVVDVGDDFGLCPDLVMASETGSLVGDVAESDVVSVCDASVGRLRVPDVDEGVHAYVAVATNDAGQVILAGCTMADPYVDSGALRIALAPTTQYRTLFPVGTATESCTPDDKCLRGCR